MSTFFKQTLSFLLLGLLAAIAFLVLNFRLTPLDEEYGAYDIFPKKINLLDNSLPLKKSIIIGGSSVRYGLDTKLLNDNDSVVYYNFGMYAGYGIEPFKYMIEYVKNDIDELIVMLEDDLYYTNTNKGTIQTFQFLKSNLDYLVYDPASLLFVFDYFTYQSKLFINSIRGEELETPKHENINFLIDNWGNTKTDSLFSKSDFQIYPDRILRPEDNFDSSLVIFFDRLKNLDNLNIKFTFSPILSDSSTIHLINQRRKFLKEKFRDFEWIDHNLIYTDREKFFNSRYHLTTDEKFKFSLSLKSNINSANEE